MPHVVFCGGGSLGHLCPAVAVWESLQEQCPQATVHILCADRQQEIIFLKERKLPATALRRLRLSPRLPLDIWHNIKICRSLLRRGSCDALFVKGGSMSVIPAICARYARIPTILHESDRVMGRANGLLARLVDIVCTGFEESAREVSKQKIKNKKRQIVVTGNPIRTEVSKGSRKRGLQITGFSGDRPILLVLGGSQGAQAINDAVLCLLPRLTQFCDVLHITGPGKLAARNSQLVTHKGYWSTEFAHKELPHLYAVATLALSRGGASFITELAANGIPTIIVPLEGLAQNHQVLNAEAAAESGGAILLWQHELRRELIPRCRLLLIREKKLQNMAEAWRGFARPNADRHIASIILECVDKRSSLP